MRIIDKIIIHHSDTNDNESLNWQAIRKYHCSYRIDGVVVTQKEFARRLKTNQGSKFEKPFSDIGYHFGIEKVGDDWEILVGRGLDKEGAHTLGQNIYSIGICFVGNWNIKTPPEIMIMKAVYKLIIPLCMIFNLSEKNIFGHYNFNSTDCPGKLFPLKDLQKMVKMGLLTHGAH